MNMTFNIDIDDEYKPLLNDLVKMFIILIIVNILMYVSDSGSNKLLGESYVKLMIFILLGISTYWLVIQKLLHFK